MRTVRYLPAINARAELKTPYHPGRRIQSVLPWRIITNDKVTLQTGYLSKDFNDPAELDINNDYHFKLVYRLFIP